jgi:hypothetical protein
MDNNSNQGKIRNINFYLPKAFKFYSLKNEYITPCLFVVILIIGLVTEKLTFVDGDIGIVYLLFKFLFFFISDVCFSIYLIYYLKELKGEKCSLKICLKLMAFKAHRIICLSFIYFIVSSVVVSIMILFNPMLIIPLATIPLMAVYMIFMLNICYITDQNYSVFESFMESKYTVEGYSKDVFRIFFLFVFTIILSSIFILLIASLPNNKLIFPVIFYFVYTVIRFMLQRFKALLYYDIEYSREKQDNEEDF